MIRNLPRAVLANLALLPLVAFSAALGQDRQAEERELGRRLFADPRFATTRGDFSTSCLSCHLVDEDPQGLRAHTDFLARSWFAWRPEDPRREHPRNTPTLFDVGELPALHYDGEFATLEALVRGTLRGRPMGWLPGEEEAAQAQLQRVLVEDASYHQPFLHLYGADLTRLTSDEVLGLVSRALTSYLRGLKSPRRSAYDRFVAQNQLPEGPAAGERNDEFATTMMERLDRLDRRGSLKLVRGFDRRALEGLRIFLRREGRSAGNCVTCHTPPHFSDFAYHNVGVSQEEYDRLHGAGSFAGLSIPSAATTPRPIERFRRAPSRERPGEADLGYWNFARITGLGEHQAGSYLNRQIATFKTPTLRHLAYSSPYMHNGFYSTLEDVLRGKIRWSELARQGHLRSAAEELKSIRLSEDNLPPLLTFLESLGEVLVPGHGVPPLPRAAAAAREASDNYPRY